MKFIKSYEYWPSFLFYLPILPYAVYLAIKAKNSVFFYATNPGIKNAGDGTESKYKTLQLIPCQYRPNSLFVPANSTINQTLEKLTTTEIYFPLIIKPDIGFRGLLVKKIENKTELIQYLEKCNSIDLIIQEFISYPLECGLLFYKIPNEKTGNISSLTFKKFISVTGDGITNISALIQKNNRTKKYIHLLKELNESRFYSIPPKGKIIQLGYIGNHSKGTQFINAKKHISNTLIETFNQINKQINGWDYGRIDIKYNSFEELEIGKSFTILEINGIISEPTHIYDSSNGTYIKSLKEICKHWRIIYTIATSNIKKKRPPSQNLKHLIQSLLQLKHYTYRINKLKD